MSSAKLREYLLRTTPDAKVRQWIDPLTIETDVEGKLIRVFFPHVFFGEWLFSKAGAWFESAVRDCFGPDVVIEYPQMPTEVVALALAVHRPESGPLNPEGDNGATPDPAASKQPSGPAEPDQPRDDQLRDLPAQAEQAAREYPFGAEFTFGTFLANDKNHFPLASAREIAGQTTVSFNPFLICGESGTGKTHLLRAVANELAGRLETKRVYVGSLEEMHNIYSVSHNGDQLAARGYFYGFSALLIDDFQAIESCPAFQQEIITLFNFFHENGRQMVFACAGKLAEWDFPDPKLKSRLNWGLLVYLKKPDLDVRSRYIQDMCRKRGLKLTRERILSLAQRFQDFRALQGVMLRIFAYRELVKKDFSEKELDQVIDAADDSAAQRRITPDAIVRCVSEHFGLDPVEVLSARRTGKLVVARQAAMFLCRSMLGLSFPQIGRVFGGRDHGTALYAVKKLEQLQKDSKDTKNLLKELKRKCLQPAP